LPEGMKLLSVIAETRKHESRCQRPCSKWQMNSAIRIVLRWKNLLTSMDLQNQFKPGKSQASPYFPGAEKQCWTASFPASVTGAYGMGKTLFKKVSSAHLETVL